MNNPSDPQSPIAAMRSPQPGEFPIHLLPEPIRELVLYLSTKSSFHESMIAMGALTTVSASIGRKLSTQLSTFDETTPCNIFTLLGSNTTTGKSIFGRVIKPIIAAQNNFQRIHSERSNDLQLQLDVAKQQYKNLKKQIVLLSTQGLEHCELKTEAVALLERISILKREMEFSYELCLSHPTGAAMRKVLAAGDHSLFMFSLDGGSILQDAFSHKDKLLSRFLLSGFTGEETGSETSTCGSFRGQSLLSFLFTVQPHILYELLFNQKAAQAGLLNRPIVIDSEFLEHNPVRFLSSDGKAVQAQWRELIDKMVDFRFAKDPPIVIPWNRPAEETFENLDMNAKQLLRDWPEDALQHSGRTKEIAVRLAGILLAIEVIYRGENLRDDWVIFEAASRATGIMQWLFLHRLKIQKSAYHKVLCKLADDLEKKIQQANGTLRLSRIKDSHPQIDRELTAILAAFPSRFTVIEESRTKPGPVAQAVVLKQYPITRFA